MAPWFSEVKGGDPMNYYRWPIVGRLLRDRAKKRGARAGAELIRRGYSPEAVLVYANRCAVQAAESKNHSDLYSYTGMVREAADRLEWARGEAAKL